MKAESPPRNWRIAVVSDMNESYGSKTYQAALKIAMDSIRSSDVNVVLSTGDMVAGQKPGLDYKGMWSAFHNHVTHPLSEVRLPLLPSPGNHDAATGSRFKQEREEYRTTWLKYPFDRFNNQRPTDEQIHPLPGVTQNFPFHYAVTMGPAVFIALDSTVPGRLINEQFAWLATVLERTQAYKVKIIFGHFPLYPFAFQRAHEAIASGSERTGFFSQLESLLEKHKVDLYLSGHHHVFYPGRRNGHTRYLSVPLLGTGARYLLSAEGEKTKRAPQGFLLIDLDAQGSIDVTAIESPSLTRIPFSSLPNSVSVPSRDSDDCRSCASFPAAFFIDPARRMLYRRW